MLRIAQGSVGVFSSCALPFAVLDRCKERHFMSSSRKPNDVLEGEQQALTRSWIAPRL